jgi:ABC-type antimicrobial peptide transport system permease subunit
VPADTGNLFAVLLFAFAGLVAAGNATLLVLSRRTEFAILKAIGLRGFEVGFTVMVEVVTLATVGLLVGFTAGEIMALPIFLTNGLGLSAVVRAIGQDLGVVAPVTLGCAIVFSLAPMAKTLSITVAEVMRANE